MHGPKVVSRIWQWLQYGDGLSHLACVTNLPHCVPSSSYLVPLRWTRCHQIIFAPSTLHPNSLLSGYAPCGISQGNFWGHWEEISGSSPNPFNLSVVFPSCQAPCLPGIWPRGLEPFSGICLNLSSRCIALVSFSSLLVKLHHFGARKIVVMVKCSNYGYSVTVLASKSFFFNSSMILSPHWAPMVCDMRKQWPYLMFEIK